MPRQAFINERVIRPQEIENVAVFAYDAVEEQRGLAPHGQQQCVVEVGIREDIRLRVAQITQIEPLAGEVPRECFGPPVRQHAQYLFPQNAGILQTAFGGEIEQFVVGRAAPEEVREPRCKFKV